MLEGRAVSKKNALALAFSAVVLLAMACSNQGEGDRCKSDDDCAADLSCVKRSSLDLAMVCCPATDDGTGLCSTPGTVISNPDASGVTEDAGIVEPAEPDASEPDASEPTPDASNTTDAAVDSGPTDAGSDATPDAAP